jgi:hypothetical protein
LQQSLHRGLASLELAAPRTVVLGLIGDTGHLCRDSVGHEERVVAWCDHLVLVDRWMPGGFEGTIQSTESLPLRFPIANAMQENNFHEITFLRCRAG